MARTSSTVQPGTTYWSAGNGADVLIGGNGDTLTGGRGPDTCLFGPNCGANTITDFDVSVDVIQFNPALFANYAAVLGAESFDGHNTTIIHDANETVFLQNVAPSSLSPSNFHFS